MKFSHCVLLAILLLPVTFQLKAEILFEESFDVSPPYIPGERLPLGFGKITYGKWYSDRMEGFPIKVSEEKSRSEPMSLLLEATKVPEDPTQIARVWASFGEGNQEATSTTKPLSFSCAFFISRVDGNEEQCVTLSITANSGTPACTVLIGVNGAVAAQNRGVIEDIAPIVKNQWYVLEILLPSPENPQAPPKVTLYESQGTERGKKIGTVSLPDPKPNVIYQGFRFENRLPESQIFFDDFLVTTEE